MFPSPVAAMMIDWFVSLFRGKTVMFPMLIALLGPKSVSAIQVGPSRAGRQEVGRFPDATTGTGRVDGVARRIRRIDRHARDTARPGRRDCLGRLYPAPGLLGVAPIDAAPTGVQAWADIALA